MHELALFAGAGGGILGGLLLGWRTVCAVEIDPYARSVLLARQNDGTLSPFPVWDDIRTFDGRPWRGIADVVSGGFPCQDISLAGKGDGLDGPRSRLWVEMARIISEVQPLYAVVENSPALTGRGLGRVLGDLAEMGFDARWGVIGAAHAGAPHLRERLWIVADAMRHRHLGPETAGASAHHEDGASKARRGIRSSLANAPQPGGAAVADAVRAGFPPSGSELHGANWRDAGRVLAANRGWPAEPDVGRVADGVAARVDRLKALGNGQVPRVVAAAWRALCIQFFDTEGDPDSEEK